MKKLNSQKQDKRILIVDDIEFYRTTVLNVVLSLGYQGLLAQDGSTAVKIVEENPKDIDLVLLDLSMPPSNDPQEGLRALQRIKRLAPNLRVVVMTSFMSLRKRSRQLGAQGFIEKELLIIGPSSRAT